MLLRVPPELGPFLVFFEFRKNRNSSMLSGFRDLGGGQKWTFEAPERVATKHGKTT